MLERLSRLPSGWTPCPWRIVTRAPGGPLTVSRVHPVMFWPKSWMVALSPDAKDRVGEIVRTTRMGGSGWARSRPDGAVAASAGSQVLSSKPGSDQPGCSRRAS